MNLIFNDMNASLKTSLGDNGTFHNAPLSFFSSVFSDAMAIIRHAIRHSWDYRGKASVREVVVFGLFFILAQAVLIPMETYTTPRAQYSMVAASLLTDTALCIMPAVALLVRWFRKNIFRGQ